MVQDKFKELAKEITSISVSGCKQIRMAWPQSFIGLYGQILNF